ncbi:TolC family protein [Thaumasiovibrio subtropicus]|uniref:TolC family protein n=1 Tax=Thaumasiovibrio subtropicus TaxID=1891207 RepID=UPI00131C1640|nr:TolC family protein [Thaumasiovibrio subtropicus]
MASSLEDAATVLLEKNLGIYVANGAITAAEYDADVTRSGLLPSLSLSANTTYNSSYKDQVVGADVKNKYQSHGYSISLSQTIFNASTYFKYKNSLMNIDIEAIKLEQKTQTTLSQLANEYISYLKTRSQYESTQLELKSATQRLKQVTRNIELGNTAANEIYEVRSQKIKIENSLLQIESDMRKSLARIYDLTYTHLEPTFDIPGEFTPQAISIAEQNKLINQLNNTNLDLIIARIQIAKKRTDLRESKSSFAPTLSASVSYSHDDSNNESGMVLPDTGKNDQVVYALNFNMPIYAGGSNIATLKKTMMELENEQVTLRESLHNNETELRNIIEALNHFVAANEALKQIVIANYNSFQGIQRAYSLGTRTLTDVLSSETKLYSSIRDYNDNLYNYQLEKIKLYTLLGSLNFSTIQTLNASMIARQQKAAITDVIAGFENE